MPSARSRQNRPHALPARPRLDHRRPTSIAAGAFYDAVFGALGVERLWRSEDAHPLRRARGTGRARSSRSSRPPTPHAGGPRHWAFRATSTAQVDAFHAAGLAAGGTDDGPPGPRPSYHEHYYGAFLIDPDGNRVEAVCHEG